MNISALSCVARLRIVQLPAYPIVLVTLSYAEDWSRWMLLGLTSLYAVLIEYAFICAQRRDIAVEAERVRLAAEADRDRVAENILREIGADQP